MLFKKIGIFKSKNTIVSNTLYKIYKKNNFDQYKERPKRHFMILYKFVEDMHYKRIPHMEDHLKLIDQYEKTGSFFPNDGGLILFQASDETVPDSFIKKDPYYKNGLVENYEIKELELHQKKKFDELAVYYKYK